MVLVTGCCAQVETTDGVSQYTMQRVRMTRRKTCERKATRKIGPLDFCTVHARMVRKGLIDERGVVLDSNTLADIRRYPQKWPRGLYDWHRQYPEET